MKSISALRNGKHEAFAREFVRTRSAREAYRRTVSGVEASFEKARKLRNMPSIRKRIAELEREGEDMAVSKADLLELHMDVYDLAIHGQEDYGFNVKKGCYELTGRINRDLSTAEKALAGIERLLSEERERGGEGGAVRVIFDAPADDEDGEQGGAVRVIFDAPADDEDGEQAQEAMTLDA